MTPYIHQTNDVIDAQHSALPRAWRNVSGLDKATAAELKAMGWLPVTYVNEAFDPATQIRTGPAGVDVGDAVPSGADGVTGTFTVRDKTAQELDDEKDAEAASALNNRALKAYIMAVNDGSIVPGGNMTGAQLKAAMKAKL